MSSTLLARCARTGNGHGLEKENRHAVLQGDVSQIEAESAVSRQKSTWPKSTLARSPLGSGASHWHWLSSQAP